MEQQGNDGVNSSQSSPFFHNDQWTYTLVTELDHLQHGQNTHFHNPSSSHMSMPPPFQQLSEVYNPFLERAEQPNSQETSKETHSPLPRVGSKQKKVSRRGGGFAKEEDRVICSAFLNVSKDPITGVNQPSGGYYKRIFEYFDARKPTGSNRSQIAIEHRWRGIQKAINRFAGCKSLVDRRNESGKTERDRLDDAVKLFEEKEAFVFMHFWEILRDEPKWNDRMLELNNTSTPCTKARQGTSSTDTIPIHGESKTQDDHLKRPEGRDSAKKKRSRAMDATSASTVCWRTKSMHTVCILMWPGI